jgi:MoaA/NifB/PqqE/SkfB family radical SAM enzyme
MVFMRYLYTKKLPDGSQVPYEVDLLAPSQIVTAMLELTSRCNLRCVYCMKSHPRGNELSGRDDDMSQAVLDASLEFVRQTRAREVLFAGQGETTLLPNWTERCAPFFALPDTRFILNSNFARLLEPRELEALLSLHTVFTSIDSDDPEVMRTLRRSVDLGTVVANVIALRATALKLQRPATEIGVNCVMSTATALHVFDVGCYCKALGVQYFNLLNLYGSDYLTETFGIRTVAALSADDFDAMVQQVRAVNRLLSGSATRLLIDQGFNAEITRRLKKRDSAGSQFPNGKQTRLCLMPWTRYTIGTDGLVYPCCVPRDPIGSILETPGRAILMTDKAVERRMQLLQGELPVPCLDCNNAGYGPLEVLTRSVAEHMVANGLGQAS